MNEQDGHLSSIIEVKRNASRRKYHFLYKTTCVVTGKYYYGMHSTDNLNDGYKGSGTVLSRSLSRYGTEQHICEILSFHETRKLLIEAEKAFITMDVISEPLCMNLITGGGGAKDHVYGLTPESRKRISEASKRQPRTKERYEKVVQTRLENGTYNFSEDQKAEIKEKRRKTREERPYEYTDEHRANIATAMKGRECSDETRAKLSASLKGKQQKRGDERTPMSAEAKENIRQARIGKKASEEARANMSKAGKERGARLKALHAADPDHIPVGSKRCTIDGVEIFNSLKDLSAKYGRGKNGARHPDFRYL